MYIQYGAAMGYTATFSQDMEGERDHAMAEDDETCIYINFSGAHRHESMTDG